MAWYGRSLWALAAGAATLAVALPLTLRRARAGAKPLSSRLTKAVSLFTLLVLLGALGSVAAHEYATWMR